MSWLKLRFQVLNRDDFKCQMCGMESLHLEVHHIKPKKQGGDNTIENLVSLCHKCHTIVEPRNPNKKYEFPRKLTVITVSQELRNALKELGKKGESYEDILWRLIKESGGQKK